MKRGTHRTGADGECPHARAPQLTMQASYQSHLKCLGGGVRGHIWNGLRRSGRRHDHQVPPAPRHHRRKHVRCKVHHRHAVEAHFAHLGIAVKIDKPPLRADTGVQHRHLDGRAQLIEHAPYRGAPLVLGDVGGNPAHLDPMLAPGLLSQCRKPVTTTGHHYKRMPSPGQPKRDLGPDASRGPRDKCPTPPGRFSCHSGTTRRAVVFPSFANRNRKSTGALPRRPWRRFVFTSGTPRPFVKGVRLRPPGR